MLLARWRREVEKIQRGEALEIAIERYEPVIARKAKRGQIGVRPQMVRESGRAGQRLEVVVKAGWFCQKTQDRNGEKLPVNDPRFLRAQRIGEYAGMGAQAQKAQRGDTAKRQGLRSLLLPIMAGGLMLYVPLVDQR